MGPSLTGRGAGQCARIPGWFHTPPHERSPPLSRLVLSAPALSAGPRAARCPPCRCVASPMPGGSARVAAPFANVSIAGPAPPPQSWLSPPPWGGPAPSRRAPLPPGAWPRPRLRLWAGPAAAAPFPCGPVAQSGQAGPIRQLPRGSSPGGGGATERPEAGCRRPRHRGGVWVHPEKEGEVHFTGEHPVGRPRLAGSVFPPGFPLGPLDSHLGGGGGLCVSLPDPTATTTEAGSGNLGRGRREGRPRNPDSLRATGLEQRSRPSAPALLTPDQFC